MPSHAFRLLPVAVPILVLLGVPATAQTTDQSAASIASRPYPVGVFDFSKTIVIPRQRALVRGADKVGGVPAPFLATQPSWPAGSLRGTDPFGTVFCFAPTVAGQLIKTAGYGEGYVGGVWNNNNSGGDKNLRSFLCGYASDFTVDGQAQLRTYPFGAGKEYPKPDVHGRDHPRRADGLCAEGNGFRAERLRFFQIPGTALVVKSGRGALASAVGIYDSQLTEIRDIFVSLAINGVDVEIGDAKVSHIYATGIAKDGLIIGGSGTVVEGDHIWAPIAPPSSAPLRWPAIATMKPPESAPTSSRAPMAPGLTA